MKIVSMEVEGLFGRSHTISGTFNSDINILTGRNGAGKTSILKLLWYIVSGNVEIALREVNFRKCVLVTESYSLTVNKINRGSARYEMTIGDGNPQIFEDEGDDETVWLDANDVVNEKLKEYGRSVFFPTFRRIEGGFTLESSRLVNPRLSRPKNEIEAALANLSRALSGEKHHFVSSISTVDVVSLLLRQYADLSEQTNLEQATVSQEIIEKIKSYTSQYKENAEDEVRDANNVISGILSRIEEMEESRDVIMTPLNTIRELSEKLFKHAGIKISPRLSFGDAATAITSDLLSAGEKQMLSFISYNSYFQDSIFFIDEPELSLHVDWQRQLFSILSKQNPTNQFILATHSPFIYSKYPDKEFIIDHMRGDEEALP